MKAGANYNEWLSLAKDLLNLAKFKSTRLIDCKLLDFEALNVKSIQYVFGLLSFMHLFEFA